MVVPVRGFSTKETQRVFISSRVGEINAGFDTITYETGAERPSRVTFHFGKTNPPI
jgi:hypothetical protein